MNEVLEKINKIGIVPVVTIDSIEDAIPLAKALCEGGLPCAEVTFRTAAAKESIQKMTKEFPNMIIGAGTVLNISQVDEAVVAGARFIVSPGLNPKVVQYCINKGIVIIPGCSNPTDIEQAIEFGIDTVKFFPAEAAGGINISNLNSYLEFDKIIACGGTWMVKQELIREGSFKAIENITREAVETMLSFELLHIGVNTRSDEEANYIARELEKSFGFKRKENSKSIFLSNCINIMKSSDFGKNGYLSIGSNNLNRAIYHLVNNGYMVDENSRCFNKNGKLISIYLRNEIAGYAIKLIQK